MDGYLPGTDKRSFLMRYDTAVILKRFWFCEQSLILSQAGWIASVAPLEAKLALCHQMWESAMTADAQRKRVFELRYPNREMEMGQEQPLIRLLDEACNAPSALAFVRSLAEVFKPALLKAYRAYMQLADELSDGPSLRFMKLAITETSGQIERLNALRPSLEAAEPTCLSLAEQWVRTLENQLQAMGGIGLETVESPSGEATQLPDRVPFRQADAPARDTRFKRVRYYWQDIIDPNFPYGEGMQLQLRSAISHLNEVWAIEAGGANLYAFGKTLGWDFIFDAARWTYDESRHCRMGLERLLSWGFKPEDLPLGTYIYDAGSRDNDPIYRLGMLYFFETKNIGEKPQRIKHFQEFADAASQHDMDFDWADETIHASYGTRWLGRLLELRGDEGGPNVVRDRCRELVESEVAAATEEDIKQTKSITEAIIKKAEKIVVEPVA